MPVLNLVLLSLETLSGSVVVEAPPSQMRRQRSAEAEKPAKVGLLC